MKDITFNGIKQSLIDYYSQQEEFKDFNWTAPAITTLIEAQAYLAHYLLTYSNFALNESFLDTAQKRSSVVSKAKNIGYYPNQYTSSVAKVKLDYIGNTAIDDYVIPVGTTFSSTNNGITYYFRTYEPVLVQKTTTGRYWCQLSIREGTEITNTWTQNQDCSIQFVLSNPKVDLSTLEVTVYSSVTDTKGTIYSKLESLSQIGPKSTIYTIEENIDGNVQLYFGDGILSKKILPGNIVKCKYLASSGASSNGLASFQLVNIPSAAYDKQLWTTTTIEISNSGQDRESIESIKYNAPRFFQRQGRNVIANDYSADVLKHYSELIDAISVWGGENNDPPEYGSVYMSIKPKNALALTTTQKQEIIEKISESSVVGITPKIVDPNVLYVNIQLDVIYNKIQTKITPTEIEQNIIDITHSFFNNSLSSYNVEFRGSKYLSLLFGIDDSISDVNIKLNLYQYMLPFSNTKASYIIDFKNAIEPGSVFIGPYLMLGESSLMYYMEDDGNGNLQARSDNLLENVGSVDYETGIINIKSYTFTTYEGEQIPVMIKPASNNMSVKQNYIFSIDTIDISLNGK